MIILDILVLIMELSFGKRGINPIMEDATLVRLNTAPL
jgi:hypothetical protein